MINGYFWKDREVVEYSGQMFTRQVREDRPDLENCPCVDIRRTPMQERYGTFRTEGWFYIPLEKFPPEFRMHLLLLGVS